MCAIWAYWNVSNTIIADYTLLSKPINIFMLGTWHKKLKKSFWAKWDLTWAANWSIKFIVWNYLLFLQIFACHWVFVICIILVWAFKGVSMDIFYNASIPFGKNGHVYYSRTSRLETFRTTETKSWIRINF